MKLSQLIPTLALTAMFSMASALTLQAKDKTCDPSQACSQKEKMCGMSKMGKCGMCDSMKKLNLTDEQQQKVKDIKESKKSEFAKIRTSAKKKVEAVMKDMEKEFRKILTPEQSAKLDAMKSKKDAETKSE